MQAGQANRQEGTDGRMDVQSKYNGIKEEKKYIF